MMTLVEKKRQQVSWSISLFCCRFVACRIYCVSLMRWDLEKEREMEICGSTNDIVAVKRNYIYKERVRKQKGDGDVMSGYWKSHLNYLHRYSFRFFSFNRCVSVFFSDVWCIIYYILTYGDCFVCLFIHLFVDVVRFCLFWLVFFCVA